MKQTRLYTEVGSFKPTYAGETMLFTTQIKSYFMKNDGVRSMALTLPFTLPKDVG